MDLNSYAELAVRLVNTRDAGGRQDELATIEAYQGLMVMIVKQPEKKSAASFR